MRETVPSSWLRVDSCQPAKSVTSTMAEALISASASLPFFSFRRLAAAVVMVAVISSPLFRRMATSAGHGAELDAADDAGELVACGGLHGHPPEQPVQGRQLGELGFLLAQELA
jgi:hypothetical protein